MIRAFSPIPALRRGFVLHPDDPDDPYVFRIEFPWFGVDTCRVVFTAEPGEDATAIHLDLAPISFERRPARTNPRIWGTGALVGVAAATAATVLRRRLRRTQGGDVMSVTYHHRALVDGRHGARRNDQNQAGLGSGSHRSPSPQDRFRQPLDQRRGHRARPRRRSKRPTLPIASSRMGASCRPFHGVPFTVKANIDVTGTPTTMGLEVAGRRLPGSSTHPESSGCAGRGDPDRPHQLPHHHGPPGIRTASSGVPRSTRGPVRARPEPPAAERPRRSPPA